MSLYQVGPGVMPSAASAGGRMYLAGAREFAKSLGLGQVLKGRVLRQYEGDRYLVNFGGDERVVDSGIPLRTGEILHGRVVALGDRVEMQRVYPESIPDEPLNSIEPEARVRAGSLEACMAQVLDQYQAGLNEADYAQLLRAVRGAGEPETMAMAGAYLHKLGFSQTPALLEALYARLTGPVGGARQYNDWTTVPQLESTAAQTGGAHSSVLRQFGDLLQRTFNAPDEQDRNESNRGSTESLSRDHGLDQEVVRAIRANGDVEADVSDHMQRLAQWLLNAQNGGSVSHRLGTLPLILGGRLVEVDVAMFEQRREQKGIAGTHHRHVALSLRTEQLGRVDVVIGVAGGNVRVRIATDSTDRTTQVAEHGGALRELLDEKGWQVDEISYETRVASEGSCAPRSVVEHVITQDSVNRLI